MAARGSDEVGDREVQLSIQSDISSLQREVAALPGEIREMIGNAIQIHANQKHRDAAGREDIDRLFEGILENARQIDELTKATSELTGRLGR